MADGPGAARIFGVSAVVSVLAIVVAFVYGGVQAAGLTLILGVLEVTLSFDNAVVNARVLARMSAYWQRIFLTVGILVAVVGMRLVFPLLVVGVTAHLSPVEALRLAFEKRPISDPGSYAALLHHAHPQIAAFGGVFLLMLFLDWLFTRRDITWLSVLEKPLGRMGRLDHLSVIVAGVVLVVIAELGAEEPGAVLSAGVIGLVSYLAVHGLGAALESREEFDQDASAGHAEQIGVVGRAAFFLFLYLEVLDASFSFDGVIGAFAITPDPVVIALGLGVIGSLFVRSITVFLVRKGTLADYVYLEHGAHWAIGALAGILLISIRWEVDEVVTGLVGAALIAASFASSVVRNRRQARP